MTVAIIGPLHGYRCHNLRSGHVSNTDDTHITAFLPTSDHGHRVLTHSSNVFCRMRCRAFHGIPPALRLPQFPRQSRPHPNIAYRKVYAIEHRIKSMTVVLFRAGRGLHVPLEQYEAKVRCFRVKRWAYRLQRWKKDRFCVDMEQSVYWISSISISDRYPKVVYRCRNNDYHILLSAADLALPAVLRLLSLTALAFQNKLGLSPSAT